MDKWCPAEKQIQLATDEVEKMAADERLTEAVFLLGRARDMVADFIDGVPFKKPNKLNLPHIKKFKK